jgi:hypothetical protein
LREVGLVQSVIWNRRTKRLIDGHLRVELAMEAREATLPVTVVDLSEDEERTVLATLDPIGAMAVADRGKLEELLAGIHAKDAELVQFLASQHAEDDLSGPGVGSDAGPARTFMFTVSEDDARFVDEAFDELRGSSKLSDDQVFVAVCRKARA